MDAPLLKTALPGPKAAALIARDNKHVSPSYTRDYPLVMAGGSGAVVEDVDGNLFLDCAAGIAVNATGHQPPRRRQGHRRSGAALPAHVRHGLLLRAAGEAGRGHGRHRPDLGRGEDVLRQLGHRGRGSVGEAGEVPHEAVRHHRVPRVVPRPQHGVAVAHVEQDDAAARVRAAAAGRVSRAVCDVLPLSGRAEARDVSGRVPGICRGPDAGAPDLARRSGRDRRRGDPGRRRVPGAAAAVPPAAARR